MKYLMRNTNFHVRFLLVIFILSLLQFVLSDFSRALLIEIYIWSIYAMAFDLLYGYSGMISFGQALFFGLGGYGQMLMSKCYPNLWLGLLAGLVLAGLAGLIVGSVVARVKGAYLAIMTLLFATITCSIANAWESLTGGTLGFSFKAPPIDLGIFSFSLYNQTVIYYFVILFFMFSYYILRRITRSPFGMILKGIRENEERTKFLGYKVERYKMMSFIISALFCGLAGVLLALTNRYHSSFMLNLPISANALLYAIVGGVGTLIGPAIGTAVMIFFVDYISSYTDNYQLIIGALLIFVITVAPRGLMGVITDLTSRFLPGDENEIRENP